MFLELGIDAVPILVNGALAMSELAIVSASRGGNRGKAA